MKSQKCQIDNCLCCHHPVVVEPRLPRGRPRKIVDPTVIELERTCLKCGETKVVAEFKPKLKKCLSCWNEYHREYYSKNEEFRKKKIQQTMEKKKNKKSQEQNQ